jgi:hypothetical protein
MQELECRDDGKRRLYCAKCGLVSSFTNAAVEKYFHHCDPNRQRRSDGPGTELKRLLASLGVTECTGCGCSDRAIQMNRWGVDGCRERFETIRAWLIEAQVKTSWFDKIRAGVNAARIGLPIDLADIAGSLVRIAIERADQTAAS